MTGKRRFPAVRLGILIILLAAALFVHFGRSVWVPVKNRLFGKKTVAMVVDEISSRRPGATTLVTPQTRNLTLIVLKQERTLELWTDGQRRRSWPLTAFSGTLGPKLEEGDGQIPEGLYHPTFLHPNSSYHLSIKLDYPNEFDRRQGEREKRPRLGGNIYIHGKSATVGCIPVGDAAIEEIFYAVARVGLDRTAVIIAPYDMRRGRRPELEKTSRDWTGELYDRIGQSLTAYRKTH